MIKRFLTLAAVIFTASLPAAAQDVQRAAAVVNDLVISTFDVEQRIKLVFVTSGQQASGPAAQRIRAQVLRTLIDELLQLQAAQKDEIQVTEQEINQALARVAQQSNTSVQQILDSLASAGIYDVTLKNQIKAELAWSKLIEERIAPRINISEADIDAQMTRLEEAATKPQYLVSEIFVSFDGADDEPRARRVVDTIYAEIQRGTPFPALAEQYSQAPSASRGGDIGWVQDTDVTAEVWAALQEMRPQTLSRPVRAPGGYYVLALRDKLRAAGSGEEAPPAPPGRPSGVPAGFVKLKRVVMGMPSNLNATQRDQAIGAAGRLRETIRGCQGLDEYVRTLRGVAVIDLPVLPMSDLAPELRSVITNLNPSDVSQPFFTQEGQQVLLNLIVVCGDRLRQDYVATREFKMPSREDVANRLFNQEISVAARRFMRDLRRDAAIDIREDQAIQ